MIKAVLFDYGGVLSMGGAHGSVRRMLAAALGIDEADVKDLGDTFGQYMRGEITDDAFLHILYQLHPEAKRRPSTADMLIGNDIFNSSALVYDLARRLREHDIKTGILSNMMGFGATALREKGVFDGFDPVLMSAEVHAMKPEPEFYTMAIKKLGVPSKDILFIDDQQVMLDGAERLGLQGLLAINPRQIVQDTTRLVHEQNGIDL